MTPHVDGEQMTHSFSDGCDPPHEVPVSHTHPLGHPDHVLSYPAADEHAYHHALGGEHSSTHTHADAARRRGVSVVPPEAT